MEKEEGLFEVDGSYYTLKFNLKKVKMIERMLNISFVAEVSNSGGLLSFNLIEALFSVGLYDAKDEKAVKGKKATDIFETLLRDVGYSNIIEVVTGKVEEDLGFLFQ